MASRPVVQLHVPPHGPAEIAGIPIADSLLEQLRANASIEPVLVDDDGTPVAIGKRFSALSPKIVRAVLLRDGHCRCTDTCDVTWGLQIHHLRPRSWGGTDDASNLIAIARGHHPRLIPHGPWALVGNPNLPDGIDRVHVDDLSRGTTRTTRPPTTETRTGAVIEEARQATTPQGAEFPR